MGQAGSMVFDKRSPRYRPARLAWSVVGVAVALGLSGCIAVPVAPTEPPATQVTTETAGYVDRLKAMPVAAVTENPVGETLQQFVTDSRNIACVFTSSRAGHLNQPWEPNNYTDSANAPAPIVPVVNCQMVNYPQVQEKDRTSNCAGTNIAYLGGTVLLDPAKAAYGNCRAGVTAVEASFGPRGTVSRELAELPVLSPGQAMDGQGYRCGALDDGVACANLAAGTGFFVAANTYELYGSEGPVGPTA